MDDAGQAGIPPGNVILLKPAFWAREPGRRRAGYWDSPEARSGAAQSIEMGDNIEPSGSG
jgi:hypothetical protein